jgi:hypothetical protein
MDQGGVNKIGLFPAIKPGSLLSKQAGLKMAI